MRNDARFQLITAEAFDSESETLVRPHNQHRGRFIVYCEGMGAWPDDTFSLRVVSLITGTARDVGVLGVEPFDGYDYAVFGLVLPPGDWELQVHSATAGRIIASRKVVAK